MTHSNIQRVPCIRVLIITAVVSTATATIASGAIIFESGTLGPTGLEQGTVAATNVNQFVFTGVRFELTQPVATSQVGGHFVDRNNGTFFGAVVALDDENDFPDSADLTSPDVLGHAELTFPVPSDEVFGDLEVSLNPGWYALVFGSGLFGTSGDGAATRNNLEVGDPTYIAWQPGAPGLGWFDLAGLPIDFSNHHFVVSGTVVPEPSTIMIFFHSIVFCWGLGRGLGITRRTITR